MAPIIYTLIPVTGGMGV